MRLGTVFLLLGFVTLVAHSGTALAEKGSATAGQNKASLCIACHGPKGMSSNPLWPNLAGQKDEYLAKQMRAFKSGERKDPLMSPMSAALSEQDILDLAAYYASL